MINHILEAVDLMNSALSEVSPETREKFEKYIRENSIFRKYPMPIGHVTLEGLNRLNRGEAMVGLHASAIHYRAMHGQQSVPVYLGNAPSTVYEQLGVAYRIDGRIRFYDMNDARPAELKTVPVYGPLP